MKYCLKEKKKHLGVGSQKRSEPLQAQCVCLQWVTQARRIGGLVMLALDQALEPAEAWTAPSWHEGSRRNP